MPKVLPPATGALAGTRSFAVTMYDADAPTGSGFEHRVATAAVVGYNPGGQTLATASLTARYAQ